MISRRHAALAARALSIAATFGAAIVVPLVYVPALASPFALPKEVALELAAALGAAALLLRLVAGGAQAEPGGGGGAAAEPPPALPPRAFLVGAGLVLASGVLSAIVAGVVVPSGTPYAVATIGRWAALFGLACGALVIGGEAALRADLLRAVAASAGLVSAIGLLQHVDLFPLAIPVISSPGSTFGNRNMGGEAIAVSIPLALAAVVLSRGRRDRWLFVGALALGFLYLAATRARGAWIGGAAGVTTMVLLDRRSWSRASVLPALGIGAVALLVALVPGPANPRYASDTKRLATGVDVVETTFDPNSPALRSRLALWSRSVAMVRTSPLTGIGPGNWAVLFPRYAEPGVAEDGVLTPGLAPRHAHNDLIEWLTETGAVGLGCLLGLGVAVVATTRRNLAAADGPGRISTAAAAGTLVALVGAGITGFPLQMPATLVLGGLSLGLIFANGERTAWRASSSRLPSWAAAAMAVVILLVVAFGAQRRLRASAWLAAAERALHSDPGHEGGMRAMRALDRAADAEPTSFRISLRKAHAAVRLRYMSAAVAAAKAALAIEPYSPNAWATLAAAQRAAGDPYAARTSADRALQLLDAFPFALHEKARAAEAVGDRVAADAAWTSLATIAGPRWPDRATSDGAQALLAQRHWRTQVAAPPPTSQ